MRVLFASLFGLMTLLSSIAVNWKPAVVDQRVVWLTSLLEFTDADGDGRLSRSDVGELLSELDVSGDGELTVEDAQDGEAASSEESLLAFLLREADSDANERITRSEVELVFDYLDRTGDAWLTEEDLPHEPQIELLWCSDDNPVRREQIRMFNMLHPDYRLRLDPVYGSGMEKTIVQCLAGVGPDLFDCYTGYQLSAFVRSGIALDITDDMARIGVRAEAVWPSLRPYMFYGGRYYGNPNNASAPAVFINKRMFDEAGLPYPQDEWTWDDCIRISKALTRRNERGQITRYGMIGLWDWQLALYQFHAPTFTPEGTRCVLDAPEAAEAIQFMQDLIYVHEVMPTPQVEFAMASAGGWASGILTLFGGERSAMAIAGRWWLCTLRNPAYRHLDLGAVAIPGVQMADGSVSRRVYAYSRSTLVNAHGKKREGALLFQAYLHGRAFNELVNRQADAMAAVAEYNYTAEFECNPDYPKEDYNEVWRQAMENSEPLEVCPYANGQTIDRILRIQLDLARANLKSGADAMRDAAQRINESIIETLAADPELRVKYYEELERGALPAWEPGAKLPWEEAT